jgi:prepilin-type N-terminal cleavage/methylation domain-containing protein
MYLQRIKSMNSNRGMSLVELIVVMGILSIVMLAVMSLYIPAHQSTVVQTQVSDVQSNLRLALNTMTSDLLTAGFLASRYPVVFPDADTAPNYDDPNLANMGIATALTAFRRVVLSSISSGEDPKLQKSVRQLVSSEINLWLTNPVIIEALRSKNRTTGRYTEQQIKALESKWQDEFVSGQYDLIAEVLDRPVSRYLKRVKLNGLGMYHEILLMDGVGLLAGVSETNDDYWQGDESKWLETYRGDKGTLHVGELNFDESTMEWEIEVSLPVFDPEKQKPLGAITIGLDPSALVEISL